MKNIIVIKCGGSTIDFLSDHFFDSMAWLQSKGYAPVIVHGGGPAIGRMLAALHIHTEFVDGLRKTDGRVMEVVERVLCGSVNKNLIRQIEKAGLHAVGLSGCDNRLIEAKPLNQERLGFVGDVSHLNVDMINHLVEKDIIPVIAPVGTGPGGKVYNINADTAAGAIALELGAEKMWFVTDVPGIFQNDKLLHDVTEAEIEQLINDGTIHSGMIPKVKAALNSLAGSLHEVMIVDGKHSKLVMDGEIKGTIIKKAQKAVVS